MINRNRAMDIAALLLLAITGVWYLRAIGTGALWIDEVLYARAANSMLSGDVYVNWTHMFAPVGKYVIAAGIAVFGTSEFGVRIGPAVVGLATLPVVYLVARRLGRRVEGLLTIIGLSVTPLLATHFASAMLDSTLILTFTVLVAIPILVAEQQLACSSRTDTAIGALAVLVSATKAYGVLFAIAPVAVYLHLRALRTSITRPVQRAVSAAVGTAAVIFLPHLLSRPPLFFGNAGDSLPDIVLNVFEIPLLGGPLYAFAVSLYTNVFLQGERGPVGPLETLGWIAEAGPLVAASVIVLAAGFVYGVRHSDRRLMIPGVCLLSPILLFVLVLPKGYPRYLLPIVPVAVLVGVLWIVDAARALRATRVARYGPYVAVSVLVVSASMPFLVGGAGLSPDSGYDQAVEQIRASDTDTVAAQSAPVLAWYLGQQTEPPISYNVSEAHNISGVTLIGLGTVPPLKSPVANEYILNQSLDYVVFGRETTVVSGVDIARCSSLEQTIPSRYTRLSSVFTLRLYRPQNCSQMLG